MACLTENKKSLTRFGVRLLVYGIVYTIGKSIGRRLRNVCFVHDDGANEP